MYGNITTGSGPKRKFATREEWHKWVDSTAGSITDESFVRPADAYFGFDEVPSFDEENILSRQ